MIYEYLWEEHYKGSSIVGYEDSWDLETYRPINDKYMTKEEAKEYNHPDVYIRPIENTKRERKK